jgi:hypothetical protein
MENGNEIKYESFYELMKGFYYGYPFAVESIINYKYSMRDNLMYFKREILENLILLNSEKKIAYLNRLKFGLEEKNGNPSPDTASLEKWYKIYNSPKESDSSFNNFKNPLFELLDRKPPTDDDFIDVNLDRNIRMVQNDFYRYYYDFYLKEALDFTNDQINQLQISRMTNQIDSKEKTIKKLKTNLSVPELALLFKMLNELKPTIFEIESDAELHRFISDNFSTKKSPEISVQSLRNEFSKPDPNAKGFWEKHLYTMTAMLRTKK